MIVQVPATAFDFGPMAERYDRWYETTEGAMYDRLEKGAVVRLLPDNGRRKELLDVGCGTGHWARFFSQRGFEVTGIDLSPSMVRVARGKRIAGASFAVADAHELPFDSGRFRVTTAIATLEFVRDPAVVLREMVRVTQRPRGLMVVGVLNALAPINRHRKAAGELTYKEARFFSPRELKALLSGFGEPRVTAAAWVPQSRRLLRLAPLTDTVGRWLDLPYGAFLVGSVSL
jgi:ubiquinone/menaquinone biosynthesis C-methylase UbiE